MDLAIVVSVLFAAAGAVLFRAKGTPSVYNAHYRQQLFVSDIPGASPLEVDEAITRLQLWRGSWDASVARKHDIPRSQRLAYALRTQTGGTAELLEGRMLTNQSEGAADVSLEAFEPYRSCSLSQPPAIIYLLAWLESCGGSLGEWRLHLINFVLEASTIFTFLTILEAMWKFEKFSLLEPTIDGKGYQPAPGAVTWRHFPWIVILYLVNPLSILFPISSAPRSMVILPLLWAIAAASHGRPIVRASAPVSLALALYLFPLTPMVLLFPVGHLLYASKAAHYSGGVAVPSTGCSKENETASPTLETSTECCCPHSVCPDKHHLIQSLGTVFYFGLAVATWLAAMHLLSFWLMGYSWEYLRASVVDFVMIADLRPNVGVFWYVMQLIFERFRTMFLVYFHGHIYMQVSALYIRMFHLPVTYAIVALATLLLFQPYPNALDFVTLVCLLSIRAATIKAQKPFVILVSASSLTLCMVPVMATLWLRRDTGNPNFVYVMQMTHILTGGFLLMEWVKEVFSQFAAATKTTPVQQPLGSSKKIS